MGRFVVVGEVVVVPFAFSNLKSSKRRPALVVALAERDVYILCQITSKKYASKNAIVLREKDFVTGKLPVQSYIRLDKLFTAEPDSIIKSVGVIEDRKKREVLSRLMGLFGG